MNVLSVILLVVFAVIGVISFVRDITFFIFRYKKDSTVMFITPLNGKCEDAEYMLRSAAAKIKWISGGKNDYMICLNCDMDDDTKEVCEKICKDYGFAKLLNKKEFIEMI